MRDREFLMFIHERLENVHGESPIVDYMHKLRAIIESMPADVTTPNTACFNSLADLQGPVDKKYYLQDARGSGVVGNCMLWWGPNRNGYVCNVKDAYAFTREEAFAQHKMRSTDKPWPKDYIDSRIRHHVDIQHCLWQEAMDGAETDQQNCEAPENPMHYKNPRYDGSGSPAMCGSDSVHMTNHLMMVTCKDCGNEIDKFRGITNGE